MPLYLSVALSYHSTSLSPSPSPLSHYTYTSPSSVHLTNSSTTVPSSSLTFLTSWQDRLKHFDADFCYLEPVLSLRVSTLHSLILQERQSAASGRGEASSLNLAGRQRVEQLFGSLSETLLTLAKRAQDVGRYQVSI